MANITKIADELSALTVMEASDLSKLLEERWGVSAIVPAQMVVESSASAKDVEANEKKEFDIILVSAGEKKIGVIKVVRTITGLGLKEAKALVDAVPSPIKQGVSKEEADTVRADLEAAGATVEVK